MPTLTLPKDLTPEDYTIIEAAVMETVRGRWFLMEFARRSRAAELQQIRDAIVRLERAMLRAPALSQSAPTLQLARPEPALPVKPSPNVEALSPFDRAYAALSQFNNLALEKKMALFG